MQKKFWHRCFTRIYKRFTAILPSMMRRNNYGIEMTYSKNSTEDILNAIQAYLRRKTTPYAIAIDGEWGVGKTFLVQNAVGKLFEPDNFLYISLYGLKSIRDIEEAMLAPSARLNGEDVNLVSKLLNANPDFGDDIKVGGLGYAVQFAIAKWRQKALNDAKKVVLCFDDIERWQGDIGVCLGFINELAEHKGAKCLILGDFSKIPDSQVKEFQRARTKVIRYSYNLHHSPERLLTVAESSVLESPEGSDVVVPALLQDHRHRICDFIDNLNCKNIRLVVDALLLYQEVATKNEKFFLRSSEKAVSFFEVALAVLYLLRIHSGNEGLIRSVLSFEPEKPMELFSYVDGDEGNEGASDEVKHAVNTIMGFGGQIQSKPIITLAKIGYYREIDFEGFFAGWGEKKPYERYIDTFSFWYLPDEEATEVLEAVLDEVFTAKTIAHPELLLRIADRLTSDIKRGVVSLDFEETKRRLTNLINELYDEKKMEYVQYSERNFFGDKNIYCKDISKLIEERNGRYLAERDLSTSSSVWRSIGETPDEYLNLLNKEIDNPIFAYFSDPKEVISVLNGLSNGQLFELTRWMGSRIDSPSAQVALEKEKDSAHRLSSVIEEEFENTFSVRAGHMKQISRILKNRRTDYDLEYFESEKAK